MRIFRSITVSLYMAVVAVGLTAGSAHALLIDNGASTTDTATGLEWLDLTATDGQSYNSVVVGGFGGFVAAGYNVATLPQVCGLFGALGDFITNCDLGLGFLSDTLTPESADTFLALLGKTFGPGLATHGAFDAESIVPGTLQLAEIANGCATCFGPFGPHAFVTSITFTPSETGRHGIWLVRLPPTPSPDPEPNPVPEPATFALLAFGLAGLGIARRRRSPKVTG